jgi:hypothetical protein
VNSAKIGGLVGSVGLAAMVVSAVAVLGCSGESEEDGGTTNPTGGTLGVGGGFSTGGTPGLGGGFSTGGTPGDGGAPPATGGAGSTGGSSTGGSSGNCTAPDTWSFFVMSLEAIRSLSGNEEGFGGDIGGLSGADQKCQVTAESVGSCRQWHAFLSVTDDGSGSPVHAIERIGAGPWYDINGYRLSSDIDGLLNQRPDGDTDIVWVDGFNQWPFNECLTTELGNCNHTYGDTHDTITGSGRDGMLVDTDPNVTCNDWTSTTIDSRIPIGHSWPRRLDGGGDGENHWIYAHEASGCGVNINLTDSMEDGLGGDGGYGAWYCFAYD